jgi:NTP pyrophosphatase (non-canonical NTP hydrolase)
MSKIQAELREIQAERERQDARWGEQNHEPMVWLSILTEEVGEVAKAILEGSVSNYREEIIQCAAVSLAALQSLNRNEIKFQSVTELQEENARLTERLEGLRSAMRVACAELDDIDFDGSEDDQIADVRDKLSVHCGYGEARTVCKKGGGDEM